MDPFAEPAVDADALSCYTVDEQLSEHGSHSTHYDFCEEVKAQQLEHTHKGEANAPLQVMPMCEVSDGVGVGSGAEVGARAGAGDDVDTGIGMGAGISDKEDKQEEENGYPNWSVFYDDDDGTSTFDDNSDCVCELLHDGNCDTVSGGTPALNPFINTLIQVATTKPMLGDAFSSGSGGDEKTGKVVGGVGGTLHTPKEDILQVNSAAIRMEHSHPVSTKVGSDGEERVDDIAVVLKQDSTDAEEREQETDSLSTLKGPVINANQTTSPEPQLALSVFYSAESDSEM